MPAASTAERQTLWKLPAGGAGVLVQNTGISGQRAGPEPPASCLLSGSRARGLCLLSHARGMRFGICSQRGRARRSGVPARRHGRGDARRLCDRHDPKTGCSVLNLRLGTRQRRAAADSWVRCCRGGRDVQAWDCTEVEMHPRGHRHSGTCRRRCIPRGHRHSGTCHGAGQQGLGAGKSAGTSPRCAQGSGRCGPSQ